MADVAVPQELLDAIGALAKRLDGLTRKPDGGGKLPPAVQGVFDEIKRIEKKIAELARRRRVGRGRGRRVGR